MPIRYDIEILLIYDNTKTKIGWMSTCYDGDEVLLLNSTHPIKKRRDIKPWMKVMVWNMSWTVIRKGIFL